jgi:hypothetical protein
MSEKWNEFARTNYKNKNTKDLYRELNKEYKSKMNLIKYLDSCNILNMQKI